MKLLRSSGPGQYLIAQLAPLELITLSVLAFQLDAPVS